jgi:GNAT superfamily N-acetyltransferase
MINTTDDAAQVPGTDGRYFQLKGGSRHDALRYAGEVADLYETDFFPPAIREQYLKQFPKSEFRRKLLDEWSLAPGFSLVTLWDDIELLGFACGCPLPSGTQWWKDVNEPLSSEFTAEDGARTLAVLDIAVKADKRGHGFGKILYSSLLEGRHETRATLLSEPQLQPAYSIWLHWGYRKVGTAIPSNSSGTRDVLVRTLT